MRVFIISADDVKEKHIDICKRYFPHRYEKSLSFYSENDAKLCIAASYLIYTFAKAEEKDIYFLRNNKPYIKNSPVFFNVSHSKKYAVIAVAPSQVGVDIEKAEEKNLVCARRVFLENERKWINNETSKFSVLWTLKESVMKALGEGFALAPKDFDVMPFLDNKSITVGDTELWAYTAVYDGYSVSLCLSNEPKNKFEGIEIVRIK